MGVLIKIVLIVFLLLLIFVIGIGALARAFLSLLPRPNRSPENRPSSRGARFGDEEKAERMLACFVCGVHVPESEGIKVAGKFFCCEAHSQ